MNADASVVLFDNADHALDRASFQAFRLFLQKWLPDIALVIVSDDPEMLALAQQHYLLYEGKLVAQKTADTPLQSEEIRL